MNAATWGVVVNQWGPIVTILATLSGIALAWRQTHQASRHGVSSDEREARKEHAAERRDTLADRDNLIASLERRLTSIEANYSASLERIDELEQREDDQRTQLLIVSAWIWQAIEVAREGGITLPPPPPLMPPRPPKED